MSESELEKFRRQLRTINKMLNSEFTSDKGKTVSIEDWKEAFRIVEQWAEAGNIQHYDKLIEEVFKQTGIDLIDAL